MGILIIIILIGIIPAAIAHSKGRNFFAWWVYGILLFIIALVHSIILRPKPAYSKPDYSKDGWLCFSCHKWRPQRETERCLNCRTVRPQVVRHDIKKCPYCAEMIKVEAIVCRYCGKDLDGNPTPH